MRNTPIQWADDTCNPVMGCDGCELWPTSKIVVASISRLFAPLTDAAFDQIVTDTRAIADVYSSEPLRLLIASTVRELLSTYRVPLSEVETDALIKDAKGSLLRCYAGVLTENRGGHPGYPPRFDEPTPFPGRMTIAASARDWSGTDRPVKPWLNGLPRLIFVSDMGDALSGSIPFEYLETEIIRVALSPKGSLHRWLWLTKRPGRMAEFSRWLLDRGIAWPANLMAMTSVTSHRTVARVTQLQRVESRMRGLSVEPLWSLVTLPLDGIDWVIIGGESGPGALPFHLEWARDIREQCREAGVAFFVKQLGRRPIENGRELALHDRHGGDWDEWPDDLRIREMPESLGSVTTTTGREEQADDN